MHDMVTLTTAQFLISIAVSVLSGGALGIAAFLVLRLNGKI